jgi:hypothetical protein
VDKIAGHDGAGTGLAEQHGEMVGRMPGRRQQSDMIVEGMIAADQLRPICRDDRQDTVDDAVYRILRASFRPVGKLAIGEHIAGVRECWHPTSILQPRVPATWSGCRWVHIT